MSSTTVDDTDPRFNYKDSAWIAGGEADEFDSTSHSSDIGGAQAIFGPFTGTSIAVFSTIDTSQTKVHFFVDSDDLQNDDVPAMSISGVQFRQQVYSASDLDPTSTHTLQINLLDAGPFTLDFVVIGNGATSASSAISTPLPAGVIASSPDIHPITTTVTDLPPTTSPSVAPTGTTSTRPTIPIPTPTPSPHIITTTLFPATTGASHTTTGPIINPAGSTTNLNTTRSPSQTGTPTSDNPTVGSTSSPIMAVASGPDTTVIASVTGAIVFFAMLVVSLLLFLRRRRLTQRGRTIPNNKKNGWADMPPKSRPSLHLSIPSARSPARKHSFLLPTHNNSSSSSSNPSSVLGPPRPTPIAPAFLADDPIESPVFDIKQRPASGSTMTTRVTVGTSIGQRASVPDFAYKYPYPESPIPAVPPLLLPAVKGADNGPSDSRISSVAGTETQTMSVGASTAYLTATNNTSIFPSPTGRGAEMPASRFSSSRPLPFTPTDVKLSAGNQNTQNHRFLPTTPTVFDEDTNTVVHEDGGVRLAPKRELPPPYADYWV